MRYECKVHRVALVIDGKRRTYETPPGSYMRGVPACRLLIDPSPKAGPVGECMIEEVAA